MVDQNIKMVSTHFNLIFKEYIPLDIKTINQFSDGG